MYGKLRLTKTARGPGREDGRGERGGAGKSPGSREEMQNMLTDKPMVNESTVFLKVHTAADDIAAETWPLAHDSFHRTASPRTTSRAVEWFYTVKIP